MDVNQMAVPNQFGTAVAQMPQVQQAQIPQMQQTTPVAPSMQGGSPYQPNMQGPTVGIGPQAGPALQMPAPQPLQNPNVNPHGFLGDPQQLMPEQALQQQMVDAGRQQQVQQHFAQQLQNPGVLNMQTPSHMPQQQQVPLQMPQQQAPMQAPAAEGGGLPQGMEQYLVERAAAEGVPQDQIGAYIQGHKGAGIENFESPQHYEEYEKGMGHLVDFLRTQYSDQEIPQVLQGLEQAVHAHGGRELLQRFSTDPSMLSPEMVMPYLEGGGRSGNPYERYMDQRNANPFMRQRGWGGQGGNNQQAYLAAPNDVNMRGPTGLPSVQDVAAQYKAINDFSNPKLIEQYGGLHNWEQQRLNLAIVKNKLMPRHI